jgi:chromosome segregation ATPase
VASSLYLSFPIQESEYLEKMASQKLKSDSTIKELETEITALTEQLIQSHQQNTDYEDLMKQTAVFQNSMQDLELQNDILRRTIESYEHRFSELQVQLEKIQFEVRGGRLRVIGVLTDYLSKTERQPHQRDRQPQIRHYRQEQADI